MARNTETLAISRVALGEQFAVLRQVRPVGQLQSYPAEPGGRQSARTLHALCAFALCLFILVHIVQLFVAGFVNEVRSMITGYFEIRGEAGK